MNHYIIPEYDVLFSDDRIEFGKELDIFSTAIALSYLGYLYTERDECRKTFLNDSLGVHGIDKIKAAQYLQDKIVFTELGILRTWKLLFVNLKNIRENLNPKYSFNYLYRSIIKEQHDCLFKFQDVHSALMTNTLLGYLDNATFEFFRTFYFFIKEKESFKVEFEMYGYEEIFEKFYDKYDLTIEEYIEGLYVILKCKFEYNFQKLIETRCISEHSLLFSSSLIENENTKIKVRKVLNIISFNYDEGKRWCEETAEQEIDFTLFKEKPLYKLNEDLYVPITRKYAEDQVFNSLIYRIRMLYDETDTKFWKMLGKMFENYVYYILNKTNLKLPNKFKIIKEFSFGPKRKRKYSSDLFIVEEDNICVIELKSARPLNSIYKYYNKDELENSIKKVIKDPITQAIKRTNELVLSKEDKEFNLNKKYYFIAITMGNFPDHYSDFRELKELIEQTEIKISGTNNFSIEEFELLCGAMESNKHNIFYYLEEYNNEMPEHYSFKNYINKYAKGHPKRFFEELEREVGVFLDPLEL